MTQENSNKQQKLVKAPEMCELIGISRATLYRLKDQGMPYVKFLRSIRFDPDAVFKWLEEQNK
jgi:excisionase family DNA binding protein